jgi:hypothetical protein
MIRSRLRSRRRRSQGYEEGARIFIIMLHSRNRVKALKANTNVHAMRDYNLGMLFEIHSKRTSKGERGIF